MRNKPDYRLTADGILINRTFTRWVCTNPKATAQQVAEQFAAEFWAAPRKIESWDMPRFKLVDGIAWYQAVLIEDQWQVWKVG